MLIAPSRPGHIIADDAPETIADGLKVPLKENTWHFVSHFVTDIHTASEQEIIDAMKITWKYLRIVMEPSCAVPSGDDPEEPGRVQRQARRRHRHRRQRRSRQITVALTPKLERA